MELGQIFYGLHDQTLVLRLVGDIRHTASGSLVSSTALDDFIDARLDEHRFDDIVIDLSETEFIDSTHLGLLARTAVFLREKDHKNPTIYSPKTKITHLLRAMGFDTVFNVLETSASPEASQALPESSAAPEQRASKVILEAHRTLAALSEKNAVAFKDVIKLLEAESEG